MTWQKLLDPIFPIIEPLTAEEIKTEKDRLASDIEKIRTAKFDVIYERALDEAQRVATAEIERVRTAESKATTYLAVLAALVPLVITLQAATWENKTGPAPESAKLGVLVIATIYVAAAGYHAFKTLQVSGFQRIGESEIVSAWKTRQPLKRLTRNTLLASRRSRNAVNAKVTRIRVTHQHLVRAFGAFVLLLILDPLFYGIGFRSEEVTPVAISTSVPAPEAWRQERPKPGFKVLEDKEARPSEAGKELADESAKEDTQVE